MIRIKITLAVFVLLLLQSCFDSNPNLNKQGEDIIESHVKYIESVDNIYQDTVYVPVYSDIYSDLQTKKILLTATLSIRSTSLLDTTYINTIDYYDTHGNLVRSFLENTLVLGPMQSIDYVIEREDNSGGTGANFLVMWGSNKDTKPIFQCVMISTSGQHGLSFTTDGISLKDK